MVCVGRGNGERGEPRSERSPSCLGHAQPMMDSEMQQVTVAAAGFEHARAGTAEVHLAKEKVHPAALSQAKLPLPFPGREGTGDEGEMKQRGKLVLQCFPQCGGCEAVLPAAGRGGGGGRLQSPRAHKCPRSMLRALHHCLLSPGMEGAGSAWSPAVREHPKSRACPEIHRLV